MAPSEDDNTLDPDDIEPEDIDLSDALEDVESAEQERHRRGLTIGAGVALVIIAGVATLVMYRDTIFEPDIPVEKGEKQVIDQTDDPQCRRMIAKVMHLRDTFFAMETRIESVVPDGDPESMSDLLDELDQLEMQLRDAESVGKKANLRFDRSRKELNNWFEFAYNEISILRNLIRRARALVSPSTGPDAGDAGTAGETGGAPGDAVSAGRETSSDAGSSMSIDDVRYQRDKTLSTLHDAFEKFRVWHTSSLHPCGSNEEGETPWRPDSRDGGLEADGSGSRDAGP